MGPGEEFRKSITFRVRGVPLDWDLKRLYDVLTDYDTSFRAAIQDLATLAEEHHGRSNVATLTFDTIPGPLKLATIGGRCSWQYPRLKASWAETRTVNPRLTIDDGFIGLTTLYVPPPGTHKVDIIAISGLGGHAFGSFKERGGDYMWLRDSVPEHVPTARIMTDGYESTVAGSRNLQDLEDLSTMLHRSILTLYEGTGVRPLVFISHSLGGLILKQTIISLFTSKDERDHKILDAVHGILFFGVPHRGMNIDSLIAMTENGPNRPFIESLGNYGSSLLDQDRKFQGSLGDEDGPEVFCFYETCESPTATV